MAATHTIERLARRGATCMVPQPVPNQPGILTVDATWGTIALMHLAPGVRTVGELELIDHIAAGLPVGCLYSIGHGFRRRSCTRG
jgi:hypothetical protein